MIEQIFQLSKGNEKVVEKVVQDDNIHYIHMIFNQGEGLPERRNGQGARRQALHHAGVRQRWSSEWRDWQRCESGRWQQALDRTRTWRFAG